MNYKTDRVKKYTSCEQIPNKNKMREKSNVYRVLAVLRYVLPEKFNDAFVSEKPDIWGSGFGVEVTMAANSNEMRINSNYKKFSLQEIKEINEDCRTSSKITIKKIPVVNREIRMIESGGGVNENSNSLKDLINHSLNIKSKKLEKDYSNNINGPIDLAIIIPDSIVTIQKNSIVNYVLFNRNCNKFRTIYVLYTYYLFIIDTVSQTYQCIPFEKDDMNGLRTIARMTAEGIISVNDEEWF